MHKTSAFRTAHLVKTVLYSLLLVVFALWLAGCAGEEVVELPPAATVAPAPPTSAIVVHDDSMSEGSLNEQALLADSGFRPEINGFSFENYGDEQPATNLTAAEVYRLFGDTACSRVANGDCTLTPPGQQWMEQINGEMTGGHCEGMAALSLLMFSDQVKESAFGGQNAADLTLNNPALQREIAYWWATQTTAPTFEQVIKGSPSEILQILQNATASESYTIGVYKEDGSDGHAITPFGIEDEGDGVYAILVYDNNYPGQTRRVRVNSADDTWSYEAAINPQTESELYQGNAETQTLDLTPTSARLGRQMCPFCDGAEATGSNSKLAALSSAARYNEIFLDGDGHLLIEDDAGNRMGLVDGQWLSEISDARAVWLKTATPADDQIEPIYWLPADLAITVTLDGNTFTDDGLADLVLIGPGYSFGVEGITLEPGQIDTVYFQPADSTLVYDTDQSESPTVVIGVETATADFDFEIQGAQMQGGGELLVLLDKAAGDLVINADKLRNSGMFSLAMTRYDDQSEEMFYTDELTLQAGAIIYISYADWTAQSAGLIIEVDSDGDEVMDES
ncbi:MAG: hypothetical protein ABTQ73_02460, partial [Caldilineales bacterium]